VEKLRLSSDDQYLISAGRDGCLMVFEVKDKEVRGMKLKDGFQRPSEEILITRADLEDLKISKDNERQKLQEANAAQNNTLTINSKDQIIKNLMDKISENLVTENKKYENLLESKRDLERKYEEELKTMTDNFEAEIQELDTTYQKRVMQEVAKYEEAKRHQDIAKGGYEKKTASLREAHSRKMKQIE
jgi:cilia- and flagella-associated protein 57